jgi:hypothetical protein
MFLDKPNQPLLPSCSQTVWFNFYNMAEYFGTGGDWKAKFEQYLRHLNLNGTFYQEYGIIFPAAVIGDVLHPSDRLVSVEVKATKTGDGYSLSWVVPAGAERYRIKYSNKEIVDWLNFDPETNAFGVDPSRLVPWFAASDVSNAPAPAAAGSTQTFSVGNIDSSGEVHFAIKAYLRGAAENGKSK